MYIIIIIIIIIMVSNLALVLVVFKLHHGSEGVNNNKMFIKHALRT